MRALLLGALFNETIVAEAINPGTSILEFVSSSPLGMRKSAITYLNNSNLIVKINFPTDIIMFQIGTWSR